VERRQPVVGRSPVEEHRREHSGEAVRRMVGWEDRESGLEVAGTQSLAEVGTVSVLGEDNRRRAVDRKVGYRT